MENNPLEPASPSAGQEIPLLLLNRQIYYHVHTAALLNPILSQPNPLHILFI